ncbi:MAG TPA: ABC transporter permease [Methylomirabilota bacterium]|nr:ABC transporter permease [Methylomirabilota bacterium]
MRRRGPAGGSIAAPLVAHLGILLAWEMLARWVVPPQFLPPPSAVARAFLSTARSGELPRQLGQTAGVLAVGLGLAIVSGMAVGITMGTFPTVRRICGPYVNALYAMPTVALVPLVIVWFGLGVEAKIFLTWLVAVFPMIINAQAGVSSIPPAFVETARAFGCSRWQIFRRVVLHAGVPFFVAGARLALGRGLVGVVVAEMFTALAGLGYMIVLYGNTFRTAELFVPIVVLAMLSIVVTNLIQRLERRLEPWRAEPSLRR